MNIPSELDVLKLVCKKLDNAEISYMLTGSFASNFYATPRMTRDIDIVIELSRFESQKLCSLFQDEFYIDKDAIVDAIERQGMFNIIHNDSVYKIDFIVRKEEEYRKVEFHRRRRIELGSIPIWIVSPEDLIISKLFWAKESSSEMQIKDIENLLQSLETLDKGYLEDWIKKLNLGSVYQKVNNYE